MKYVFALMAFFFSTLAITQEQGQIEPVWHLILVNSTVYTAYINRAVVPPNKAGTAYKRAEILLSIVEPIKMESNGELTLIYSITRILIVDCDSALVLPMFDFYYTEKKPTAKSVPKNGFEHPAVESSLTQLPKSSTLYKALCPFYI